jgi:hypothetical protein
VQHAAPLFDHVVVAAEQGQLDRQPERLEVNEPRSHDRVD